MPISQQMPWIKLTIPNTVEYCNKHNYSLLIDDCSIYNHGDVRYHLRGLNSGINLLNIYDYVWMLDADVVITNHNIKIENLEISEGLNICLENTGQYHSRLNNGSIIVRGEKGKRILEIIRNEKLIWEKEKWFWQSWLNRKTETDEEVKKLCKIHSATTFNGCHYNWGPGSFVYHPSGVNNKQIRTIKIQTTLKKVIK